MKSFVWLFPYSVSNHDHFNSSIVIFTETVTQEEASTMIQTPGDWRVALEILDMVPEEEQSLLQSMRAQS